MDGERTPVIHGYIRCSHKDSVESGLGLKAQKKQITIMARILLAKHKKSGIRLGKLYKDKAVSAFRINFAQRPSGGQLVKDIRKGDHVVFARMDRAFRNVKDMIHCIDIWLNDGVNIHFCDMPIDLNTAMGRMVVNLIATIAEWQSRFISERTKEALAARGVYSSANYKVPECVREAATTIRRLNSGRGRIRIWGTKEKLCHILGGAKAAYEIGSPKKIMAIMRWIHWALTHLDSWQQVGDRLELLVDKRVGHRRRSVPMGEIGVKMRSTTLKELYTSWCKNTGTTQRVRPYFSEGYERLRREEFARAIEESCIRSRSVSKIASIRRRMRMEEQNAARAATPEERTRFEIRAAEWRAKLEAATKEPSTAAKDRGTR